jgi:hypothetical protein
MVKENEKKAKSRKIEEAQRLASLVSFAKQVSCISKSASVTVRARARARACILVFLSFELAQDSTSRANK